MWEHSPTRKKKRENLRLNRGAPLGYHSVTVPPCYHGPLYLWPLHLRTLMPHGAPHRRPRGPVRVASCHASAPLAARVGRPGSATWPQCRVAPRVGPARHVSRRLATSAPTGKKSPFFAILLIEKSNKNQIKIK